MDKDAEKLRKETSIYYDGCYPVDLDRPPTLADIEFDKKLNAAIAAQQEKYRKEKQEKKTESENRGNDVRK